MKNQFNLLKLFFVVAIGLPLSSCHHDDGYVAPTSPATGIGLSTHATLGTILVDSRGNTLYFFGADTHGQSTCTTGCDKVWPAFHVASPTLASGLASQDFAEITRADGYKQTTYKGFPLYNYSPTGDGIVEKPGEAKGDNVGKVWFVAKPNYTIMVGSGQLVGSDGNEYTAAGTQGHENSIYFVDANGRTLYTFANDTRNNNNFTAADFSNNAVWPVFYNQLVDLPTGISKSDFSEIEVAGHKQLTYKGTPLYYFGGNATTAGDVNRGETRGVSFPVWHVVNTTSSAAPSSISISRDLTLGLVMTDSKGRSLYLFSKDTDNTSHCTGGCPNTWPVFYTDVVTVDDASLDVANFNTITLPDGSKQTTYKGWPLHYFAPASNAVVEPVGETGGDGVGGLWFIGKANYALMMANGQLVGLNGLNYTSAYAEGVGATAYFVDGNGRTLYHFSNDKNAENHFTSGDFGNNGVWPVFFPTGTELPSTLNPDDFDTIIVAGTHQQLTYKGWPLYYFGQDANRGDNKGVSVGPAPGTWPVVNGLTAVAPQP